MDPDLHLQTVGTLRSSTAGDCLDNPTIQTLRPYDLGDRCYLGVFSSTITLETDLPNKSQSTDSCDLNTDVTHSLPPRYTTNTTSGSLLPLLYTASSNLPPPPQTNVSPSIVRYSQENTNMQRNPGAGASQTLTSTPQNGSTTTHAPRTTPTLVLRADSAQERHIQWSEDVVDNENMGKKSSKGLSHHIPSTSVTPNPRFNSKANA